MNTFRDWEMSERWQPPTDDESIWIPIRPPAQMQTFDQFANQQTFEAFTEPTILKFPDDAIAKVIINANRNAYSYQSARAYYVKYTRMKSFWTWADENV